MTNTARIYARLSLDSDGQGLGVERQQEDAQRYADAHGLTVVDVYVDNSVSAYSGVTRPEWERLKGDLSKGETLLAYDAYRLGRNAVDQLGFIESCHKQGITVITVADDVTLTDPTQNLMTGIRAVIAQEESRKIGERVSRAKRQKAMSGTPLKARYRTLGYTNDFEVIPEEAAVVQEAFKRLASGHSIYSISEWIKTKYETNPVTGGEWRYNSVLSILDNPRYAGFNVFKGEVIGKGTQEPIIDEALWEAANSKRFVRNQKHNYGVKSGANARKYLLTGFLYCTQCLSPMVSHKVANRDMSYRCSKGRGGCGKIGMKMKWVDDAVVNAVLARMAMERPVDTKPDSIDLTPQITATETRIDEIREAYNAGGLTMADMLPMLNTARAELAKLKEQQGQQEVTRLQRGTTFYANYKQFMNADVSEQRARMAGEVKAVMIHPVTITSNRKVDLHRIEIHWSDGEVENLGETADLDAAQD